MFPEMLFLIVNQPLVPLCLSSYSGPPNTFLEYLRSQTVWWSRPKVCLGKAWLSYAWYKFIVSEKMVLSNKRPPCCSTAKAEGGCYDLHEI